MIYIQATDVQKKIITKIHNFIMYKNLFKNKKWKFVIKLNK